MRTRTMLVLTVVALVLVACGCSGGSSDTTVVASRAEDVGGAAHGQELYSSTCSACHGTSGEGIGGLGTQLSDSEFIQSMSNAELVAFIAVGRSTTDPDNTTGIAMPPKGGKDALTEQDLADIVAYLRTLQ